LQQQKQRGILQRFGGSFRRKIVSRKSKKETDPIPAKLIKASSVQKKTLNPKWNEKFQFIVDDVSLDRFHMDIWDHDDEEQSVMDAVKSLNHISGLKGLGRYFKEVTQSARANSNDSTDDFLGCITFNIKVSFRSIRKNTKNCIIYHLELKDIPSEGIEGWFTLEKRSERSEVSGQVKLKLWLSTKEERSIFDDEDLIDASPASFRGLLPPAAVTILHQHAIQGDLNALHQAMCAWIAYSSMLDVGISYAFLYEILNDLITKWTPLTLDKDEEDMLGDSFTSFDQHCRVAIMEHRTRFIALKRESLDSLSNLLKCMKLLHECTLFVKYIPFVRPFVATLSTVIEMSAEAYFKNALEEVKIDEPLSELYRLLLSINYACNMFSAYDSIFKTYTAIDYATLTYCQFSRMLEEYTCSEMMSESSSDLKNLLIHAYMNDEDGGKSLILLIKIHFAFNEFRTYKSTKTRNDMNELSFIFDKAIYKWVDLVRLKAFARTDLSCKLDTPVCFNFFINNKLLLFLNYKAVTKSL
uniref:C2 domain-containing protein n=1 Tax=Dracunculus medinensis TaxID=318479 RepID=A0A0N4U5B0_DRAME